MPALRHPQKRPPAIAMSAIALIRHFLEPAEV
jgi:hypothetical protein